MGDITGATGVTGEFVLLTSILVGGAGNDCPGPQRPVGRGRSVYKKNKKEAGHYMFWSTEGHVTKMCYFNSFKVMVL